MKQYQDLVRHVLRVGTRKPNRTGVDTISTFNYNYSHDLKDGFPLLTTKEVSWKNIVVEMLWFLSGQTDISILKRHGCKFWDAWADAKGQVPSAYGNFWRHFPVHKTVPAPSFPGDPYTAEVSDYNDQIRWVLDELRRNPMSRRLVVSAWAPGNAQTSKLPPCHSIFMMNVQNEETKNFVSEEAPAAEGSTVKSVVYKYGESTVTQRLCLHLTQRSCDIALGVPYNIASYALLLHLFSRFSGIAPGVFAHTLIDAHIYTSKADGSMADYDHVPGLQEQNSRVPRKLPTLHISESIKDLEDVERLMHPTVSTEEVMKHFVLDGYDPHPAIRFRVAV